MRAVSTSAPFATLVVDTSGAGSPTPAAASPRAGGSDQGAAFATMLATRLVPFRSGVTPHSADANPSEPDDDRHDDHTAATDASSAPGLLAAVAGAMTMPAAATANVRHVSRDPNALAPALRERLGRVVARMQREYGHNVQIAESGRTQARQDYLFTQGRTRPGPVVTWTHDSAHTRGRAVDVTIDGSYDDPTAFAHLQQIAQAEGLHTLGARDPGHLELPREVPGEVPALTFSDGSGARVTVESFGVRTEPGVASPASRASMAMAAVAPVAQVAAVANLAAVAQVAVVSGIASSAAVPAAASDSTPNADRDLAPGHRSHIRAGGAPERTPSLHAAAATPPSSARDRSESEGAGADTRDDRARDDRGLEHDARAAQAATPHAADGVSPVAAPTSAELGAAASGRSTSAPGSAATPAGAPVLGAIAAERLARVLDAQQAAAPRTVSHLTLRVERAEGGEDRIRLDLRGRAVDARIDVADLGAADHLAAHTPELRAALAQHGLSAEDVRVRSGAEAALDRALVAVADSTSAAGATGVTAALGRSSRSAAGNGGAQDQPHESPSRDAGGRNERQPDERSSGRDPRDGGEQRADSNPRQGRRPPADAYLDAIAPRAVGRGAR